MKLPGNTELSNMKIEECRSVKYLGVLIDKERQTLRTISTGYQKRSQKQLVLYQS